MGPLIDTNPDRDGPLNQDPMARDYPLAPRNDARLAETRLRDFLTHGASGAWMQWPQAVWLIAFYPARDSAGQSHALTQANGVLPAMAS